MKAGELRLAISEIGDDADVLVKDVGGRAWNELQIGATDSREDGSRVVVLECNQEIGHGFDDHRGDLLRSAAKFVSIVGWSLTQAHEGHRDREGAPPENNGCQLCAVYRDMSLAASFLGIDAPTETSIEHAVGGRSSDALAAELRGIRAALIEANDGIFEEGDDSLALVSQLKESEERWFHRSHEYYALAELLGADDPDGATREVSRLVGLAERLSDAKSALKRAMVEIDELAESDSVAKKRAKSIAAKVRRSADTAVSKRRAAAKAALEGAAK